LSLLENGVAEGSNNLSSMREEVDFIPDALYTQIVKCLPIVSVEGLIVIDGVLLFLRRNNEPVKGCGGFAVAESAKENLLRLRCVGRLKKKQA